MQTDTVRDWLEKVQSDPAFAKGPELQDRIAHLEAQVSTVNLQEPVDMPNLPMIVLVGVLGLGTIVSVRALRTPASVAEKPAALPSARYRLVVLCGLLVIAYVTALAIELNGHSIGFRIATLSFVIAIGACLSRDRMRTMPWIVALALLMAFGLEYLLTRVFVIDLP